MPIFISIFMISGVIPVTMQDWESNVGDLEPQSSSQWLTQPEFGTAVKFSMANST